MIKLFALDMDGTLLGSDNSISDSSKEALIKLNEAGVKTVLCSGRIATSLEYYNKTMGLENPVVANNGAVIKLSPDKILNSYPLDDEDLKAMVDFASEHMCVFQFYDEDTFYSTRINPIAMRNFKIDNTYGMGFQCNLNISADPYQKLKDNNKRAYKILVGSLGDHPYGEDKVIEMFSEKFAKDLYMTTSGRGSFEIMKKGVSKWNALAELADFLGIRKEEIAAIGDSYNDLPMLEKAEISFAMGNADDFIKSKVTMAVADNNSTGIAEAAEEILRYNKENPSV